MRVETIYLRRHDWVPNNPQLPALMCFRACPETSEESRATYFEKTFTANGWPAQWRDGIYDFHHYHSTAHEVLGCFAGTAHLLLGGPRGRELTMQSGDVLVLPAGTGHKCESATADFRVVGAYPEGQEWDICKQAPTERMLERIAHLPIPQADPLEGGEGPITKLWSYT